VKGLCAAIPLVLSAIHGEVVAQQPNQPHEFEIARAKLGAFDLRARTRIDWRDGEPYIDDIDCVGDNQEIVFVVGRNAGIKSLNLLFPGPPEPDGDRTHITGIGGGDTLWLWVDGKKYETQNISLKSDQFANFAYSPKHPPQFVIGQFRGYRAIRKAPSEPFQNISILYSDLLNARRLEWAFKSRNWEHIDRSVPENALPGGWERLRYRIDNRRLKEAYEWCVKAVTSEDARRLPHTVTGAES
jgi:hypothetical protein